VSNEGDRLEILRLLSSTDGLSNLRVKSELDLGDEQYVKLRDSLIADGFVEKYVCRGGGIRIMKAGEDAIPALEGPKSTVAKERDLQAPFVASLRLQVKEDCASAIVIDTHSLRARGRWQNPDVTVVAIEQYPRLRTKRVTVTTYEIKQFPKFDTAAVFETASHHRFAHEAWVVLEWPKDVQFSLTSPAFKVDQLARECRRFGIGLATMHPHYSSYRLRERIEPEPRVAAEEDVEAWLEYVFSRDSKAEGAFEKIMDEA
jgi:hypothetical protein